MSITAVHTTFTGQSGAFWGSKVFPRALKPLQRIHPTEVTLHRDYTALNVRERNKGGIDLFDMAANSSCRSKDSQSALVLSKVKQLQQDPIIFSVLTLCRTFPELLHNVAPMLPHPCYLPVLYGQDFFFDDYMMRVCKVFFIMLEPQIIKEVLKENSSDAAAEYVKCVFIPPTKC